MRAKLVDPSTVLYTISLLLIDRTNKDLEGLPEVYRQYVSVFSS